MIKSETGLPWQGNVRIEVVPQETQEFKLHLRIPAWASSVEARINGEPQVLPASALADKQIEPTASGYDPRASRFWSIQRTWAPGDVVEMEIKMDMEMFPH